MQRVSNISFPCPLFENSFLILPGRWSLSREKAFSTAKNGFISNSLWTGKMLLKSRRIDFTVETAPKIAFYVMDCIKCGDATLPKVTKHYIRESRHLHNPTVPSLDFLQVSYWYAPLVAGMESPNHAVCKNRHTSVGWPGGGG